MSKKVALVTGGGRGIGFGICEKLAADGFNLVVSGRSDASKVTDAVAKLESQGAEVLYCWPKIAPQCWLTSNNVSVV